MNTTAISSTEQGIPSFEVRRKFGKILQDVIGKGSKFIVQPHGEPIAVIVPIEVYQQWKQTRSAFFTTALFKRFVERNKQLLFLHTESGKSLKIIPDVYRTLNRQEELVRLTKFDLRQGEQMIIASSGSASNWLAMQGEGMVCWGKGGNQHEFRAKTSFADVGTAGRAGIAAGGESDE